jgi:hypothetical protein
VIKKPQKRRRRPDLGCRAIRWMDGVELMDLCVNVELDKMLQGTLVKGAVAVFTCFVFGRSHFQISVQTLAILTDFHRTLSQLLHGGILLEIGSRWLSFISFSIYYILSTPLFDVIYIYIYIYIYTHTHTHTHIYTPSYRTG